MQQGISDRIYTLLKAKLFNFDTTIDQLKLVVSTRLLAGQDLRPRVDFFEFENPIVSILFPEVPPDELAYYWSKLTLCMGTFEATNIVFSHRILLDIMNTATGVTSETPCLSVYAASAYNIDAAVLPYDINTEFSNVTWHDKYTGTSPLIEMESLRNFIFTSSHHYHMMPSALYISWLESHGFIFEFHEPYTKQSFDILDE